MDPNPQPPVVVPPPPSNNAPGSGVGGNNNPTSGTSGTSGTGNNSGTDGANVTARNGLDQGRDGASGVGTPGRSGNPSPTPSSRVPSPAGGRTIPTFKPTTSKTAQEGSASGSDLLPFTVVASPFPVLLEESPIPSPSPTPDELVTALDDLEPEPTEQKSSWLPLISVIAGLALVVAFLRARKKRSTVMRNHRVSGGRDFR